MLNLRYHFPRQGNTWRLSIIRRYGVEFPNPAWIDLDLISDYHMLEVVSESARKIISKILDALERLEQFPLSCPLATYKELAQQGYRVLVCGKYVCIYKYYVDYKQEK